MSKPREPAVSGASGPTGGRSRAAGRGAGTTPRIPLWPGIVISALCLLVYLIAGVGRKGLAPSTYPHHALTANAWLHGRLHVTSEEIEHEYLLQRFRLAGSPRPRGTPTQTLREDFRRAFAAMLRAKAKPGQVLSEANIDAQFNVFIQRAFHDWVRIGEQYYAYWPPLSAAVMLPFVATAGPAASDVLATNFLGGVTILFVYLMLRALAAQWPALTTRACVGLTLFYGLGTVHLWQACVGQVWFLTQIAGTLFLVMAICCGLRTLERPAWIIAAGAALGLAFLARNTIILATPFFVAVLWLAARSAQDRITRIARYGGLFGAMLVLAVGIQLGMNAARFGDWRDFGQGHLADAGGNPRFAADFKVYGRFDLHYVSRNLFYYFVNPMLRHHPTDSELSFHQDGNSLFLISPLFLAIFLCWRSRQALMWASLLGAIPGTAALMLFHGTGYYTFGPRYLLDTLPFFVLLTAFGLRGRLPPVAWALIAISIGINAWGTYRFCIEQP